MKTVSTIDLSAQASSPGTDGSIPCTVTFTFDPADPLALALTINKIVWKVSREVIYNGCSRPSGLGDVHVSPYGPSGVSITLCGDDDNHNREAAVLVIRQRSSLLVFLRSTYRQVPKADEVEVAARAVDKLLNQLGVA